MTQNDSGENGDSIDTFTADGITAALSDKRMAEPDEHPAEGAFAYTVTLYPEGDPEGVLLKTTYTAGPGISEPDDAKSALWSLAGDAYAAYISDAPLGTTDLTDPEVRKAVEEFKSHYGYEDTSEALEAYSECVQTLRAFRQAGADPNDLYERLDR